MKKKLLAKTKSVPRSPGVYLMKNNQGRVIYVGKAANLRNRLSSYFTKATHSDMKTQILVKKISSFDK